MEYFSDQNVSRKDDFIEMTKRLFKSLDYEVYEISTQESIPDIFNELIKNRRKGDPETPIKLPELAVRSLIDGRMFFLDVRWISDSFFSWENIDDDYPYLDTYYIIFTREHIKCISYRELRYGLEMTIDTENYLYSRDDIWVDSSSLMHFQEYAGNFMNCSQS